MTDNEINELTEGAARALGLSGVMRKIGAGPVYVLDKASAERWGGQYLFDPVRNGEDAFYVAGVAGLAVAFGTSYAIVRTHAKSGPAVTEMYNRHTDRFAAARVAIARCITRIAALTTPDVVTL